MECDDGQKYTAMASDLKSLEKQLDDINIDLRTTLFAKCQSPCISTPLFIRTKIGFRDNILSIPANRRVIEIDGSTWHLNIPSYGGEPRGIQYPLHDKILLRQGNWCRETMLHEALHRFSIFSHEVELRRRFSSFEDGLTEFLVGLVLFVKYPKCYQKWKDRSINKCSMTHRWSVLRFYAFSNFIDIGILIRLYFWQPSISWNNSWSRFINEIRNSGYKAFHDVIQTFSWADPPETFFTECGDIFGNKFRQLYSSPIEYSHVLYNGPY